MKRARVPEVLWGVFVVNCNGEAVWLTWCATRDKARRHAASNARVYRREGLRYIVRKFVAGQRVDG